MERNTKTGAGAFVVRREEMSDTDQKPCPHCGKDDQSRILFGTPSHMLQTLSMAYRHSIHEDDMLISEQRELGKRLAQYWELWTSRCKK